MLRTVYLITEITRVSVKKSFTFVNGHFSSDVSDSSAHLIRLLLMWLLLLSRERI